MSESVVISVTNSKGGVGKSTTALNLGAALAANGKTVLLIDNDVQGNLTAALGFTPAEQKNTLAKLLLIAIDSPEEVELHLPRAILHTESGVDLIPANARLSDAAARLQVMQLSQYSAVGEAERPCERVLFEVLAYLTEAYDYIIIDCGLKHELLTVNALAAADYCIIPVQAHYLASEGIPDVLEMVKKVQARFNHNDRELTANSFYIIDDAKQRGKMTEEFYNATKREIAAFMERADYLIKSGSRSPSVMEKLVIKIGGLEEKKRHYEDVLKRELDGLDDEFGDLRLLSQELSVRAKGLRARRAA